MLKYFNLSVGMYGKRTKIFRPLFVSPHSSKVLFAVSFVAVIGYSPPVTSTANNYKDDVFCAEPTELPIMTNIFVASCAYSAQEDERAGTAELL